MEEHYLLYRPKLHDPDAYGDGHLELPTLATTSEGEVVHSFLLRLEAWAELISMEPHVRVFRLTGSFLTGERVVCTLIYDDSDFTQMLQVRSLIDSFTGDHGFLSNSWPSVVVFEGREFPSVEHAYQAAKTTDDRARAEIAELATPAAAKQAGSALSRRSGWNTVQRLLVMHELLNAKFGIQSLCELLLATGDAELVAVNDSGDRFWGVFDHLGENRLGELLMEVRAPRRRAH